MRRTLRRLTVGTAAITVLTLASAPAWADGDVSFKGDGSGGSVTVEAKDPGSGGGKSSGGGGGKSSGGSSSSSGGSSSGGGKSSGSGGGKSSGGGGGGRTTSVSNSGRTSVGNYSSGSPSSVSSSRPDNVEIFEDGSRGTYKPEGAYIQPENGAGPTAFFDGLTQSEAEPADPAEPAPEQPAAAAPEAGGEQEEAPQVDPAELAQTAVSQMGLEAPEIASTPNDPDTLGAVGLPVWFWVANPGETTTGPSSTSATAGAVTVNATARFEGMTITTGDGSTIECAGPGTEYPGTGIYESPDCGHVYEQMSDDQPDGLYTVDVTAHWSVEWDSNVGAAGEIPVDLTTSKQIRIGSYQTVVTGVS